MQNGTDKNVISWVPIQNLFEAKHLELNMRNQESNRLGTVNLILKRNASWSSPEQPHFKILFEEWLLGGLFWTRVSLDGKMGLEGM